MRWHTDLSPSDRRQGAKCLPRPSSAPLDFHIKNIARAADDNLQQLQAASLFSAVAGPWVERQMKTLFVPVVLSMRSPETMNTFKPGGT